MCVCVCVCVREQVRMCVCSSPSPTMHLFHVSHLFSLPLPSSFIQSLRKSYRNCTTSCSSGLPQNGASRSLNPQPYRAACFGEKLHIYQNEKLVMFGVTHICAVDGYSGKIVQFISMPVKNPVQIYQHLFR